MSFVRYLRKDRWFIVAFIVLYVFCLAPIWIPRLLPLLDQPNHLASISIWNHLGESSWGLGKYYEYSRVPLPYWGYYFPVHVLSSLFSIEVANKVFLSAYALSVPLSVAMFANHFDRSPWVSFLTFPLIFNHSFAWGFLSYVPAMPLMVFGIVSISAYLRRPCRLRWAAMLSLLMLTYFMHVLPWMFLGICGMALVAFYHREKRVALRTVGAMLLSLDSQLETPFSARPPIEWSKRQAWSFDMVASWMSCGRSRIS